MGVNIPDKINQFNLYLGEVKPESKVMGVTDEVTLPTFTYMSETMNLAGFAGEIDSPTVGQLQSAEIEIPFANIAIQTLQIASQDTETITLKAAQEFLDSETRVKHYEGRTITIKGMTKVVTLGSLKKGGYGNPSITKEVTYYKDEIEDANGKKTVLTEVDKLNGVFKLNDVDQLAGITKYI